MKQPVSVIVAIGLAVLWAETARGQSVPVPRDYPIADEPDLPPNLQAKQRALIEEIVAPETALFLPPGEARIIHTRLPVYRVSTVNPDVLGIVQYGPNEIELVGASGGTTTLFIWLGTQQQPQGRLMYQVSVVPDFRDLVRLQAQRARREQLYRQRMERLQRYYGREGR